MLFQQVFKRNMLTKIKLCLISWRGFVTELQIYFDKPKIMVKRSWIRIVIEKIEPGQGRNFHLFTADIFRNKSNPTTDIIIWLDR